MFCYSSSVDKTLKSKRYTSLSIVVVGVQGNQISALSLFLAQDSFIHVAEEINKLSSVVAQPCC